MTFSEEDTSDVPESVWQGTFEIYGVTLNCHILADGRRIIEKDSVDELFAMMDSFDCPPSDMSAITEFTKWQRGMDE